MNYALLANWIVFFPMAVSLFIALRLTVGPVDSGQPTLYRALATALASLLLFLSMVGACCRFGPLILLWLFAVGGMLVVLAIKKRDLKRSAFLLSLFSCADQPSTVNALVNGFAAENLGWLRRCCRRLRIMLQRTGDWGRATESAGLVRGARQKLALRLFCRTGKRGLMRREFLFGDTTEGIVDGLLMRLLVAVLSGWGLIVVTVIVLFIIPTLQKIWAEFGISTPPLMSAMQGFSDVALRVGMLTPALVTLLAIVVATIYLYPDLLATRPLVWFFRSYYRALTFLGLAELTEGDRPIDEALQTLASLHPVAAESGRLNSAARRIQLGMTAKDAFLQSWLLNRREASLLELSLRQHNAAWTFRQLGEITMERGLRRYSIAVQVVMVLITLMLAAVIGLYAWAMFENLALMIKSLA